MAFNIAPFIVYNLTRPKKRKEEKTMEIINCPNCGAPLSYEGSNTDVTDDIVTYEEEFFCFECDETFFRQQTGRVVWD